MIRRGSLYRLILSLALIVQVSAGLVAVTPDISQANLIKKIKKKAKKTVKKAEKSTNKAIEDSRKELAKTGKAINHTTGEIAGEIDKAVDMTEAEFNNALKYTERQFDNIAVQLSGLGQDAIMALYKEAYQKHAKNYVQLGSAVANAQPQIAGDLEDIAANLVIGNFNKAEKQARDLVKKNAMVPVIQSAYNTFGNKVAIVFQFDASVGGSGVGAGTSVGIAVNPGMGSPTAIIYQSSSGSVTTSQGLDASATIGFVRDGVSNVPGAGIDVALEVLQLGFDPPNFNNPATMFQSVSLEPSSAAFGVSLPGEPPVDKVPSIAIGASYTHALQKIK